MGSGCESHDEASAGMAAHFTQTITIKEHYRLASRQAAMHERAAEWDDAATWWQSAGRWAITHLERHWCESRAQWCVRRGQDEQLPMALAPGGDVLCAESGDKRGRNGE